MNKKSIHLFFGLISILLALLLVYGIFTGKLNLFMNKAQKKTQNHSSSESASAEYPPGEIIKNYRSAFEWTATPKEDTYDPDNKSLAYGAYGTTKDETDYKMNLKSELEDYNKNHPLSTEYAGTNKINPSGEFRIGQEIDVKPEKIKVTVNAIDVMDDISFLDEDYLLPEVRENFLVNSYDKDGNLMDGVTLIDYETQQPLESQKLKFIKINITVESYSNWVNTLGDVTPRILFYENNQDYLSSIEGYMGKNGEQYESYSDGAIYFDAGLYSYNKYTNQLLTGVMNFYAYPIRKNEKITFDAVYVCPEELVHKAYFATVTEVLLGGENPNTYNNLYTHFIKATE